MSEKFKFNNTVVLIIACYLICTNAVAMMNNYGATGLYNIPNADTSEFGNFSIGYNNNLDKHYQQTSTTTGLNYIANLGVYPNFEINIRLMEVLDRHIHQQNIYRHFYKRDLSGNLKYKLPYISNRSTRFAVGMTDVGGLAVNFRRFYTVASYQLNDFDVTAGYSLKINTKEKQVNAFKGFEGNNILEGIFGGIEYKPFKWFELLAEKESSGSRVGGRLIWNNPAGWPGALTAGYVFFDSSADNAFSVGISIPIGGSKPGSDFIERNRVSTQSYPLATWRQASQSEPFAPLKPRTLLIEEGQQEPAGIDPISPVLQAQNLQLELEKSGLDAVQIGVKDSTLVVAYQNRLFNWNPSHAIATALKTIARSSLLKEFNALELTTMNNGVPVLKTTISSLRLGELFKDTKPVNFALAKAWIQFQNTATTPKATWLVYPRKNNKVSVNFTLAYKAYYGTEWANWDYSMALRPVINVPLWKGAHLSNVYHLGTQNSYGFMHGVFKNKAFSDQLNELMIHQTVQPVTGLMNTLSYGELKMGQEPFRGFMNQGEYQLFDGYSRIYWRQGQMRAAKESFNLDYNAIGAELSWPQANLVAGYQRGEYIEGDKSSIVYGRIKLGNATLGVGLTTSNISWKRVDVSLAFPIGPEKNIAIGPITLGGDRSWSTGMGTVIDNPIIPGANLIDINPGYKLVGAALVNSFSQNRVVYDTGRLTPAYLQTHIQQFLGETKQP